MNQYVKMTLGIMATFLLSMQSHAATIWQPTDVLATGNVNILQFGGFSLSGGSLALFEDTDNAFATPLTLGSAGGVFEFVDNMDGTFDVSALVANVLQSGPITITGNEFVVAVDWGNGYVADFNATQASADATSFILDFTDGPNFGRTLAADLTPASVVPLPAAAWLFGTALLGLAGIKRRKAA